jgi:hypothetical protein
MPSADGSIFAASSSAGFIGPFPYFGYGSYNFAGGSRLYCGSFDEMHRQAISARLVQCLSSGAIAYV